MRALLKKLNLFFLDTLFPVRCLGCGKEGIWICEKCLARIPVKKEQTCPFCQKVITPQGKVCLKCRNQREIDGLISSSFYDKEEILVQAVHYFKYRFVKELAFPLAILLEKVFWQAEANLPEIIIPVPLHPYRLRWRGFNQAEELAKILSRRLAPGLEIPVANDLLFRRRRTSPQMKIKQKEKRRANIRGAFVVSSDKKKRAFLKNKKILLIDDIASSGSTLFECARVLKKAGAKEVYGLVIAREKQKENI